MVPFTAESAPPDGGYGWIIVLSAFVIKVLSGASQWIFTVLYPVLLEDTELNPMQVSMIGSLYFIFSAAPGSITAEIVIWFGYRWVAIIGGFFCFFGHVLYYFTSNVYAIYVTLGVMPGLGSNFMLMASLICLQHYFDRRRSEATGYAMSGFGLGILIIGPFSHWLISVLTLRQALLIWGAINLNGVVAGALLRPSPWKPEVHKLAQEECQEDDDYTESTQDLFHPSTDNQIWSRKYQYFARYRRKLVMALFNDFSSISNWLVSICFSASATSVYQFLVHFAQEKGLSDRKASLLLVFIGVPYTLSRLLIGRLLDRSVMTRLILYFISVFGSGVLVIMLVFSTSFAYFAVLTTLYGTLIGLYHVLVIVLLVDINGIGYVETTIGFFDVCLAVGALVGPPIVSMLKYQADDYSVPLITMGSIQAASALLILYIIWARRPSWRYEALK